MGARLALDQLSFILIKDEINEYHSSMRTTALTSIHLCEEFQDTSVETSLFQTTSPCPDPVVFLKVELNF